MEWNVMFSLFSSAERVCQKPPEKEISKETTYDQCLIPDRCGPMVDYKDHRENYCMQLKVLKIANFNTLMGMGLPLGPALLTT